MPHAQSAESSSPILDIDLRLATDSSLLAEISVSSLRCHYGGLVAIATALGDINSHWNNHTFHASAFAALIVQHDMASCIAFQSASFIHKPSSATDTDFEIDARISWARGHSIHLLHNRKDRESTASGRLASVVYVVVDTLGDDAKKNIASSLSF